MNYFRTILKQQLMVMITLLMTTVSFGQNKPLGQVDAVDFHVSLNQIEAPTAESQIFSLNYRDKTQIEQKANQFFRFSATRIEVDQIFDQIKAVFKNKQEVEIPVGQNKKIFVRMLTDSDIECSMFKNNVKQSTFSVSATRLHLLFGKVWHKQAWENYLQN